MLNHSKMLQEDRSRASFPVRELTYFLDNGRTDDIETTMRLLERTPEFANYHDYGITPEQQRERTMERIVALTGILGKDKSGLLMSFVNMVDGSCGTRIGIHLGPFLSCIKGSGTDEQYEYWVAKGATRFKKFYGCFAMTELGHGSNIAGLETTATLDVDSDEWIVDTPHPGATKWWIGGGAHTANHAAVFARIVVKGKDYGVKPLVVPLRDVDTHDLLNGVSIGDCGKKMGRDGVDNGWIQFSNVRVPRTNLLMRFTQVDRHGNVTEPPSNQLGYGALIGGRVAMARDSYLYTRRFLTIAIRFGASTVRLNHDSGSNSPILDYLHYQRRLIPRLALSIGMKAGSERLSDLYESTTNQLLQRDGPISEIVSQAKQLFVLSAGMKAFCTWAAADIIDECRQACGGLGYSSHNGFEQGFNDWVVQCTWEGDNNILALSMGRDLVKSGAQVLTGEPSSVDYLESEPKAAGISSLQGLINAWQNVSRANILYAARKFNELKGSMTKEQALEELSQQRFECARLHTRLYLISSFVESIPASGPISVVLERLAWAFALWSTEQDSAAFLRRDIFTRQQIYDISHQIDQYCRLLRPDVVGITDSFNLSDFFINSPLLD